MVAYVTFARFMARAILRPGRVALVLGALLSVRAEGASQPPGLRFRTLATARVAVHYHQGLEALAARVAALAGEILDRHEARYGARVGRVQIVLTDTQDDPNGFATPLPYPMVHLRAVAPDGGDDFGNYDDWMRVVLTHELAHVVHLEEARGIVRAGRRIFGRAPFLFPNLNTPTWMIEGLATYEETEGTAFGRGRNPDVRMVLRMAALEHAFPDEDRPVGGLDPWPGGAAAYYFGEAFLRDLSQRFGAATLPELGRVHSGRLVPYLDEFTAARVTGAPFRVRWREWRARATAELEEEAARIRARGLTDSTALTTRGVRQSGPQFSPDGAWIAFTDRSLDRFRAIKLIRPDGTGERELVKRNGGSGLAWTPDGRAIVYDEPEVYRTFSVRSDLQLVEVASGRVRQLTRGRRARDPDVSPGGRTVVFVEQRGDGSDLVSLELDGGRLRPLTRSVPGAQWGSPRWSPQGDAIVASRWTAGGHLDLVRVDPETGEATALTDDRAKDVEPTWTPDGAHVVFRSDRDGVSNLYALRLADGALLRLTNVLGGAFAPDVSPDGRTLAFANYGARGYDVHVTAVDLDTAVAAEPFPDPYPEARADPPAGDPPLDTPYRPAALLWPRFWTPYASVSSEETTLGAVTLGADPLFRHVWGTDVHYGTATRRVGFRAFYQYDRFRPTFLATAEDTSGVRVGGKGERLAGFDHNREIQLRASFPFATTLRSSQAVSLAWRRRRDEPAGDVRASERLDLGGLEAAWSMSTVKAFPFSISPVDGCRLRLAFLREDPALGSEVALGKVTADGRAYVRVRRAGHVLALRIGGGWTVGRPTFRRSFAVGGFPDGTLFDVVQTNASVLRGYPDDAFNGRSFSHANAELRVPLGRPERGWRLLPVFVRHLHAAAFVDAANAWTGPFRIRDVKTGAGAALGADVVVGHALPLTFTAGLAHGLAAGGETRAYFRTGLSF
jgi:hypothetical protein